MLNVAEPADRETDEFNQLEYVFIDDPVSSLDENHLIQLAVNLGQLINSSESSVKFIVSTHNALFYNVLYNEVGAKSGYILSVLMMAHLCMKRRRAIQIKAFLITCTLKRLSSKRSLQIAWSATILRYSVICMKKPPTFWAIKDGLSCCRRIKRLMLPE